jgi:hypothetical protein
LSLGHKSLRCRSCGFRSADASFFRRERGGYLRLPETVCEACAPYEPSLYERRITRALVVSFLVWSFGIVLYARDDLGEAGLLFLMYGAAVVSLPARILVHELGHALAANAVGREVYRVVVGRGPTVFSRRFGGAAVHVGRYAYAGGLTFVFDPEARVSRLRTAVVVIGGPGANLVAGAIFLFGAAHVGGDVAARDIGSAITLGECASAVLAGIGISQVATGIFNLIPRRFGDVESVASDGAQLLRLLKRPTSSDTDAASLGKLFGLFGMQRFAEAVQYGLAGACGSQFEPLFLQVALAALSRCEGERAVIDCYHRHRKLIDDAVAGDSELCRSVAPWLRASLAWAALKENDGSLEIQVAALAEAEPSSSEPGALRAARGACLVRVGRVQEGIDLLVQGVRQCADRFDRVDLCGFLSKSCLETGEAERGATYAELEDYLIAAVQRS